jgi:hypothetical protein
LGYAFYNDTPKEWRTLKLSPVVCNAQYSKRMMNGLGSEASIRFKVELESADESASNAHTSPAKIAQAKTPTK